MTTPQKAVIYCRVSSVSQVTEGQGLESQETRCRQYADAKGYDVSMVFPDTITGGGDFMKRPGMMALFAFLDAQPSERFVVIFDDLKRYARDVEFHLKLLREMDARGAVRECLNFDFHDTPEGKFHEIIIAATGQLEREQNGRQVAQKMKARMDSGYYVLRAPLGYEYKAVKGRGKMLFPVEPFASIIRQGFEGHASGHFATQAEVMRFFETFPEFPRGKDGHVLRQRTIDVLSHPIYTGYICSDHYDIRWQKGHHAAIVSLDVFEKVQQRRSGAAHAPKRGQHR
jgi:DNA invertase Pin-like site-specific DNA recombinase